MITEQQAGQLLIALTELTQSWCECEGDSPHVDKAYMMELLVDLLAHLISDHKQPDEVFPELGRDLATKINLILADSDGATIN